MYKTNWLQILTIIVCSLLSFVIVETVEASFFDWFKKDKPETVEIVKEITQPKTIDSEIDRLSIKYSVASSTARAIIKCESSMYGEAINRNRLPDGTIWSSDYGPFQVNDYYHKDIMKELGLDIYNQWDSLEYGFMLLSRTGVEPWKASRGCWSKLI